MATKQSMEAQNPLILRCNRLIEAFAKSDDERDFYLDRMEGFIIYVDLDKSQEDLDILEKELEKNKERYCMIPKLTFYETKKIMEGFINEKVYDIDTKEKLSDIIQSKEARENFLEFIYDHHSEFEKWTAFYQERSRIRIIEWLRANNFQFVFEEDLEFPKLLLEKVKKELFQAKASKDVLNARKVIVAKSKTYYSNEALNPRPKRGRPPKQALKAEIEPQLAIDIYTTVPNGIRNFLFTPDLHSTTTSSFSSKFGTEDDVFNKRSSGDNDLSMESLNQKLAALRTISSKWRESEETKLKPLVALVDEDDMEDDLEEEDDDFFETPKSSKKAPKAINGVKAARAAAIKTPKKPVKAAPKIKVPAKAAIKSKPLAKTKPAKATKAVAPVKAVKPAKFVKSAKPVKAPAKAAKTAPPAKKLRPIMKLKAKPKAKGKK